jgi:microcystin-dependent protein
MFGGNFAPRGYALCNGQLLSIAQNTALFSILGTTYGGDGVQTFGLPDLRGRTPVHAGQGPGLSPYTLGQNGGSESVVLATNELPNHNHQINVGSAETTNAPSGALLAQNGSYATGSPTGQMANNAVAGTGSNLPHANIQPYLTVNFIIALQGVFPSRN